MKLRTPICDLFDIEVPVFLAGMGGVAYADVCAAVSEAGGFGTLGMAAASPERIRQEMRAVRGGCADCPRLQINPPGVPRPRHVVWAPGAPLHPGSVGPWQPGVSTS